MKTVKKRTTYNISFNPGDGLEFYRMFLNKFNNIIKDEGSLIVEVGNDNHPLKVKKLFEEAGHNKVEMIKDYNKDIRVLKVIKD